VQAKLPEGSEPEACSRFEMDSRNENRLTRVLPYGRMAQPS